MKNIPVFFTALILSFFSVLSLAQQGSDKTLLLTLMYHHDAFHVVHTRLLNEHLPKRATYISSRDDLSFSEKTPANYIAQNVESRVLSEVLEQVNHNPKFTTHRVEGASIIVRYPYQSASHSSPKIVPSMQQDVAYTATSYTADQLAMDNEKRREPNSLPDQLLLSPEIKLDNKKPLYSDLL